MRPPKPGSIGDKVVKGVAGAAAGGIVSGTGSVLSTVGLSSAGGALATTGAGITATATSVAGSIPLVGGAAATTVTAISTIAAVAMPIAVSGAAVYGVYKLCKWLSSK